MSKPEVLAKFDNPKRRVIEDSGALFIQKWNNNQGRYYNQVVVSDDTKAAREKLVVDCLNWKD